MLTKPRKSRGISTLSLLVLILASGAIGAILSYLWTVAYYIDVGHRVPEDTVTIAITNVTFPIENSTYFNITVLNPSYSKADANVTSIALVVKTGDAETLHDVQPGMIEPRIPRLLGRGEEMTFECHRNWGEFSGHIVRIVVFLKDDSGATFHYKTNRVLLEIVEASFDTTATVKRFNVTIRNSEVSPIPLNVTQFFFDSVSIPSQNVTFKDENSTLANTLQLLPGQNKTLVCNWNLLATGSLGLSHNITAKTSQGYMSSYDTEVLPAPVSLNITNAAFILPHTDRFNITVLNSQASPHFSNVSRVSIKTGTKAYDNIPTADEKPLGLVPGENHTFQCSWNWSTFKGQEIEITIHSTQGFLARLNVTVESTFGLPVAAFEYSPTLPYTGDVLFNASESFDTHGIIVRFDWDFGDGTNGTGETTTHFYFDDGQYTVTLTVTDDDELTDTVHVNITVLNRPPEATFTSSADIVNTGEEITFNASESFDSDGTIIDFFWDFGDGTNATGEFVSHTYSDDGNYTVTLTATDNDNATDTSTATITILNRLPIASFVENATTALINQSIAFNASESYDPDGLIVSYYWDFGDGHNTTGIVVTHRYTAEGNFTVSLTVTDDDGATASINATKTILPSASSTASIRELVENVDPGGALSPEASDDDCELSKMPIRRRLTHHRFRDCS